MSMFAVVIPQFQSDISLVFIKKTKGRPGKEVKENPEQRAGVTCMGLVVDTFPEAFPIEVTFRSCISLWNVGGVGRLLTYCIVFLVIFVNFRIIHFDSQTFNTQNINFINPTDPPHPTTPISFNILPKSTPIPLPLSRTSFSIRRTIRRNSSFSNRVRFLGVLFGRQIVPARRRLHTKVEKLAGASGAMN